MLHSAQDGKTFGQVTSFLDSLSFLYRFYGMPNYVLDDSVASTRKFVAKACVHANRKKGALTAADIRKIWDTLIEKFRSVENIPLCELRTLVMCVFQHSTFCRFSDLKEITLDKLIFDTEYFKIKISSSKTDQAGHGNYVFLPSRPGGFLDPHMLLCLYIQKLDPQPAQTLVYLFPPLV